MKGGTKMKYKKKQAPQATLKTQDVLVRNIPTETLDKIQKQADENLRSRNNEIIAVLMKGVK